METQNTWTIETFNTEQENALKAFVKALKMRLKSNEKTKRVFNNEEKAILNNIKQGLKEVQLYKEGKLKATSAKDFLNEI